MDTEQINKHIDDLKAEAVAHIVSIIGEGNTSTVMRTVDCIVLAAVLTNRLWEYEAVQEESE